jgi:hypothetical protein
MPHLQCRTGLEVHPADQRPADEDLPPGEMTMLRKLIAALSATAAGLTMAAFGPALPARAAWSDCNTANICIFNGTSGTGLLYQWSVGYLWQRPGHEINLTGSQNNMASSIYMRGSDLNVWYIFDYQCNQLSIPGGNAMQLNSGSSYNLTGTWAYMNNRGSCIKGYDR